jgi:hypothetical protein
MFKSRKRARTALLSHVASTFSTMLPTKLGRYVPRRAGVRLDSWRWSSTSTVPMRYGFVGLGRMGYPMATNLLRKTTPQSTFTIYDINPLSVSRFVNESSTFQNVAKVTVALTPKDLAERSVAP